MSKEHVETEEEARARMAKWDREAAAEGLQKARQVYREHHEANLVFLEFIAEEVSRESDSSVPPIVPLILEDRLTKDQKALAAAAMDRIPAEFFPLNYQSALSALAIVSEVVLHG